ncbi:MAG: putative cation efflux system protein [Proteobacteria bacterium]|nr:MAG: putative cation efflux system protein [Pseudomonadota bacterium]
MKSNQQAKLKAGKITTVASAVVNSVLSILKTATGFATGSTALIADGIHSLADLITDVFTYALIRIAGKEPDEDHPYGHGKFETFGTMFLAIFLAGVSIAIGLEAVDAIQNSEHQKTLTYIALIAAAVSILANEGLYHYCAYKGKQVNSSIIIANAWHHRTDSISSVAALVGIALNMYGFLMADAIAALFVTAFLLKISYKIGRSAFDELVDASVDEETLDKIRESVLSNSGVLNFHQLRARSLGGQIFVDVHADVPTTISVSEGHAIAHSVEESIFNDIAHVADVTVHVDPKGAKQSALPTELYRKNLEPLLKEIIQNHKSEIELDHLLLHVLEDGFYADIRLKKIKLTDEDVTSLKKALESTKTPLKEVSISVRHI